MTLDSNKTYICTNYCTFLSLNNSQHCTCVGDYIKRKELINGDFCPCGHIAKWEEYREDK